jgi:prephenate dehydrogenase
MNGRVAIVGLGCVGTSIGLALRQRESALEIVGHDVETSHARKAAQMGAVSKVDWNLLSSCKGASLIILALPLPAIRETLELVGAHLEEGQVVTDTATLKGPVLEWAREYLPENVRFVTGVPIAGPQANLGEVPTGPEAAHADLFKGGSYGVMPTPGTAPEAVDVLLWLAGVLEAPPLFLDPTEYDGLQGGVTDLPALIATAFVQATVESPGWKDLRKLAGYDFAAITGPVATHSGAGGIQASLNRENLLRRLDMFLESLQTLRQWLQERDEEALADAYRSAAERRVHWLQERQKGTWGDRPELPEVPGFGEQLGRAFFGGLVRRRPRDE